MTVAEYRAAPGVHFSRLKLILQSPAHYANPPVFEEDGNTALVQGTILHAYILEGKELEYVVRPKFDPEKPEERWHGGRKSCKAWEAAQTLPILSEEDIADQVGMRDALKRNAVVQEILGMCKERERPVFANYRGVGIKALLDGAGYDNSGNRVIFDLKSCLDASPKAFSKAVSQRKYPLQCSLYMNALALSEGLEQRPAWLWIAVENRRPYNVAVYTPTPDHYAAGQRMLDYSVDTWKRCTETGVWPGYQVEGVHELPFSKWDDFEAPTDTEL
jgi:hypothetical protein